MLHSDVRRRWRKRHESYNRQRASTRWWLAPPTPPFTTCPFTPPHPSATMPDNRLRSLPYTHLAQVADTEHLSTKRPQLRPPARLDSSYLPLRPLSFTTSPSTPPSHSLPLPCYGHARQYGSNERTWRRRRRSLTSSHTLLASTALLCHSRQEGQRYPHTGSRHIRACVAASREAQSGRRGGSM